MQKQIDAFKSAIYIYYAKKCICLQISENLPAIKSAKAA